MKTKLFEPYFLICSLCGFPVKPHQSVRVADLGTSCFHSADLPAASMPGSIISHAPNALRPAVTPSAVQLAAHLPRLL